MYKQGLLNSPSSSGLRQQSLKLPFLRSNRSGETSKTITAIYEKEDLKSLKKFVLFLHFNYNGDVLVSTGFGVPYRQVGGNLIANLNINANDFALAA